jgi:hypothetical protein
MRQTLLLIFGKRGVLRHSLGGGQGKAFATDYEIGFTLMFFQRHFAPLGQLRPP